MMINPLLDAWLQAEGQASGHVGSTGRFECIRQYAWAIPTTEAIEAIVKWGPVVEIGAGTGYWASLVHQAGGDVVAYDCALAGTEANEWHRSSERTFFNIEIDTEKAAARHPDRTLLLCWPPYSLPMALDAALAHLNAGGERLIYVGEGDGGCTGDRGFHALLGADPTCYECDDVCTCDNPEPAYSLAGSVDIPRWPGIYDRMYLYQRL